ncbi:MAG: DNA cytosine methyltransferase [bacterium]
MSKNKLYGVDIFSGAGGMSLGAMNAGIEIVLAIDNNANAAATYKKNHPSTEFVVGDIREIKSTSVQQKDVFVLFGGPPCQGFSLSNTKTRNESNPNNTLFEEFLRFVEDVKPEWFVFENVEGIKTFNNGKTLALIRSEFNALGYETSEAVLYASDYGVPQHRNRFFMVGNKSGHVFEFPLKNETVITVGDAIADLPDLNNGDKIEVSSYKDVKNLSGYAKLMRKNSAKPTQNFVSQNREYVLERYKYIKQGQNWKAIPEPLMGNYANKYNCHSGIYRRLDVNKPSVVISNYRKNMLIHPTADRGLSVREAARIQSFPDDFQFEGSLMHIQQQIGNAVPPLLAEAIFRKILTYAGTK